MFAAMLIAIMAPPQLAIVARVYEPGPARSYPRAYVLSADGSGLRAVSQPGHLVQSVEWDEDGLVYWAEHKAYLVDRRGIGAIGLARSEERTPNLDMNETRMTSGDIISWGEDYVSVFGRTHKLGLISSVRVGSEGYRLYFMEKVTMIESTLWCADARTKTFRPFLTSQENLLVWHPDQSFVAFSPERADVPFDGQQVWANELWVGTLGGASRRLDLPTMELWDVAVRQPGGR